MKNVFLTIRINKPAKAIFDFTLDPKNTPKWIESINAEETSEWPPKIGTTYRNRGSSSEWLVFELTEYEPCKSYTLSRKDGKYNVRYVFKPINAKTTELEYFEWTEQGDLSEPFTLKPLEKLKQIIERDPSL